ncbi:acyl-binding protein [Moniliophthora roreri]|nr:acyl-binding protein [Moniliophthora roreri]
MFKQITLGCQYVRIGNILFPYIGSSLPGVLPVLDATKSSSTTLFTLVSGEQAGQLTFYPGRSDPAKINFLASDPRFKGTT